jgi:cytochrome b involved in lipid metabolism
MNPMERVVSWDDLVAHTSKTNLWILIDDHVYDVTTYLAEHPGGDDVLVKGGGLNVTAKFNEAKHSEYAKSIRN